MRIFGPSTTQSLLRFCGSTMLFAVLAVPFVNDTAQAQDSSMRTTLDPESPLVKTPLKKLKKPLGSVQRNAEPEIDADALEALNDEGLNSDLTNGDDEQPNNRAAMLLSSDTTEAEDPESELSSTPSTAGTTAKRKSGQTTIEPGLDAQTTGTLNVRKGQQAKMLRAQSAIAAEPVQSRSITEEENPFQAVGIRFGSMTLRPSIEQGIEATSNSTASAGGGSATNSVTTFRMDGISDWRSGSLETNGFITLRNSLSGGGTNDDDVDPEASASFRLTQPILRDWAYTIGGSYGLKRESAVSGSAFPTTIVTRPLAQDIRLSLGVNKTEGALQPSARIELGRQTFGEATDSLGASVSQSDRDQTSLRGTFRLGAELSPALTPFVEVAYGKTWRDESVDVFGNDRSSTDMRASVGAEINISEKLNGEFSVGWLRQSFGSSGLDDIDGVALAAAINWSPHQGTIVNAGFTTSAEPSNSAAVSGSLLYAGTLGITHQLSSRLSTSANFGASFRDFTGTGGEDTTLSAELAATYWVNRMLGINARARYESVSSSDPLRESDTTTLLLGLKLQR